MNFLPDGMKLIPNQGEKNILLDDIIKYSFKTQNDMIMMFIKSIINLKTDINYKFEKLSSEIKHNNFDPSKVEKGKYEIHAFLFTLALKRFIDWYSESYDSDLNTFINKYLLNKKEDLYFNEINFNMDSGDREKANQIIDALCVKFYNEVLLALNIFFNNDRKIIIIKANDNNNGYIFSFRPMTLDEMKN